MMQHWTLSEALLETLASRLRLADKSMAEHARDPLTGVYNRRALYDLYDREARRTQRAARRAARLSHDQIAEARDGHELGRSERDAASGATNLARGRRDSGQAVADEVLPLAVLFVDVDKFKTINDTYGHATGDDVLCAVAHTLSECGRATDHVARFGGDEFVMLLPEAGAVGAQLVSDRIRRRLSDTPPGPVPFSISIGAAVVEPMEPPTLDALMARADEEMYRDKARQR
jgi:diguanylate cyclase (GGDEF)-like protein